MKFYSYLNENIGLNRSAFEKMAKDCKPFLQELKKSNFQFLYSGRKGEYQKFDKRRLRKNRRPLDTPMVIHNMLDKAFEKEFGVKARSEGFFVANSPYDVGGYGNPHYVFPVGKYKLIYSYKVKDLYLHINRQAPTSYIVA